jgi:hypothetical protein
MRILLDGRPFQYARSDNEKTHFIIACANLLSKKLGVEWLLLVDQTYREGRLPPITGQQLITRTAFPGLVGWKVWYDWQIASTAKKYRPDIVMTTDGIAARNGRIRQCLWMPEKAEPGKGPDGMGWPGAYRRRLAGSLREVQTVFCFSEKDRSFLASRFPGPDAGDKIQVIPVAAGERMGLLSTGDREKAKQTYAGGKEYFFSLLSGTAQDEVVDLLKAYSLFKKRQKSNIQLVLAGPVSGTGSLLRDLLSTYKYRDDIHWHIHFPEAAWTGMAAASYALLLPFDGNTLGMAVLEAWKAGVPVIARATGQLDETAGDAALYVPGVDPVPLAGQLMRIYKDENLRNSLIEKGGMRLRLYNWERSAAAVWAGIIGTNSQ